MTLRRLLLHSCWLVLLTSALPGAAATTVGKGSYLPQLPPGASGPSMLGGAAATPKRTSKVTGPMPTNDWWSSLGWQRYPDNPYSENMFPHPFGLHARPNGLGAGYPTKATVVKGSPAYIGEYHFAYAEDFLLGVEGLSSPDTRIDGFSDWTVTAMWSGGGRELRVTTGHGVPYLFASAKGGNAVITFTAPPQLLSNQDSVASASVNGHTYGLFAP